MAPKSIPASAKKSIDQLNVHQIIKKKARGEKLSFAERNILKIYAKRSGIK